MFISVKSIMFFLFISTDKTLFLSLLPKHVGQVSSTIYLPNQSLINSLLVSKYLLSKLFKIPS